MSDLMSSGSIRLPSGSIRFAAAGAAVRTRAATSLAGSLRGRVRQSAAAGVNAGRIAALGHRRVGALLLYRPILNMLALCVLVAAAAATWYFSRPGEPQTTAIEPVDEQPPSYYLRDAEVLQTNDEGRPLYRIRAQYVEDRPDDRALVLDDVLIEWREADEVPWHVRAGHAIVWLERQILELEQGVELVREPRADGQSAVARTERLTLDPVEHVARADGEVMFIVGASTLTAVGLVAFLAEDRLRLLSNGHGRIRQ